MQDNIISGLVIEKVFLSEPESDTDEEEGVILQNSDDTNEVNNYVWDETSFIYKIDDQYICKICGRKFDNVRSANGHKYKHFDKEHCKMCWYTNSDRNEMKLHMNSHIQESVAEKLGNKLQ